jgi:hypothetical protein
MASQAGQAPAYRELVLRRDGFDAVTAAFTASAKTLMCTTSSRARWVGQTIRATSSRYAMAATLHITLICKSDFRAA